jgi:putative transposase
MPSDGIARSTFNDRPAVSFDDTALVRRIVAISDSFEVCGYRRMQAARRQQGMQVRTAEINGELRDRLWTPSDSLNRGGSP